MSERKKFLASLSAGASFNRGDKEVASDYREDGIPVYLDGVPIWLETTISYTHKFYNGDWLKLVGRLRYPLGKDESKIDTKTRIRINSVMRDMWDIIEKQLASEKNKWDKSVANSYQEVDRVDKENLIPLEDEFDV